MAVFSYILGTLIEIIDTLNDLNKEPGDDEALHLNRFISTWEMLLNNGKNLDEKLVLNIREHFAYRWENDKNFII